MQKLPAEEPVRRSRQAGATSQLEDKTESRSLVAIPDPSRQGWTRDDDRALLNAEDEKRVAGHGAEAGIARNDRHDSARDNRTAHIERAALCSNAVY